ncbi:Isochorismatase hydrolase [Gloeophyllum trabeum ATCC 11539]|uniref:Isochorismatase hydrolase n=1 Tax=Gloeophyllum trabeum (strain ATCC 11539 / FP-39264 / Madison 617) TaxID=670483 RepID=S7QMP7_GLOTA|nr:Isochorismatase hydrolase [Gloeophyllum trabeum ATCC 11539]EPQ60662.1 Isochorismatase hydrolase [Gloeophyllum trabeum ATCC 11539]
MAKVRPPVEKPIEYGNAGEFWVEYPSGLVDLTRASHLPSSASDAATPPPLTQEFLEFPVDGQRTLRIDKKSSAIVIIDMQKNWGLTEHELKTIPPSLVRGFMKSGKGGFGADLGRDWGRLLMRDQRNAELYGPLQQEYMKNKDAGTDIWIHKNRMSAIWGYQTALDLYLKENGITTLFFSGVNADQCVLGTIVDAYYRGYDCIVVEDTVATTSPQGGLENVIYNSGNSYGFVTDSTRLVNAISNSA